MAWQRPVHIKDLLKDYLKEQKKEQKRSNALDKICGEIFEERISKNIKARIYRGKLHILTDSSIIASEIKTLPKKDLINKISISTKKPVYDIIVKVTDI